MKCEMEISPDDGRARVEVGRTVLKNHLLKPGGRLFMIDLLFLKFPNEMKTYKIEYIRMVVHDWERKEYKTLLNFFSVVKYKL